MALAPLPAPGGSTGGKGGLKPLPPPGGSTSSRTGGGGLKPPKPPTGGGATSRQRHLRQVEAKIKSHGGGLGGLLSDFGDLVSSAPSGLYQAVKSGAQEVEKYGPHHLVLGAIHGDPNEAIQGVPGIGASVGITEGLTGGFTGDKNAVNDHPLSAMQGGSFRNTYEDVIHPTRLTRAYEQGNLVSKIVEDAANLSVVGGAASSAIDTAARGSFSEAINASKAANAAERAVGPAEAEAAKLGKLAAEHEGAVAKLSDQLYAAPHEAKGPIEGQLNRAEPLARDARRAADEAASGAAQAKARALGARETATSLHEAASGPLYGAYRTAHAVATLGGQGANLPAKPFELASKAFSQGVRKFLGENPALRDALALADEKLGQAQALSDSRTRRAIIGARRAGVKVAKATQSLSERRALAAQVRTIEGNAAQDALHVGRAMDDIRRITGDDTTWQTAVLHSTGVGAAIADQARVLGENPATMAGLGERLDEVASQLHMDPKAVRNAVDIANGSADPALVQRVNAANAVFDQRVSPWLESHMLDEGQGLRRSPSPEQQAFAQWQLTKGPGLPPNVEDRLQQVYDQKLESLQAQREVQAQKVNDRAEKAGVTPGATGAEAERQAAATAAQGATGRGALGPLRELQQAARAEGRAAASRTAAERIRAIQAGIPGLSDATVTQLVDAVDRFREATTRLHSAQADLAVGENLGGVPGKATLAGEVRAVRAQMVDVAKAELATLDELPADRLPFVPGDLSEYHAQLHEGIAGRETGIRSRFERLRGQKVHSRLPDEAVFRKAYDQAWNKLPKALQNSLEKMDPADVTRMFERWRDGTLTAEQGGLDTMAGEFLGERATGVPGEDIPKLLAEYQRKAELERLITQAKGNRWTPDMADQFRAVVRDPEALGLLNDPAVHAALTAGRLDDAASALAAMRTEAPATVSRQDAVSLMADNFDTTANADLAPQVERLDGGPELLDAWVRAGADQTEGSLDQALIDIGEGRQPSWMAGQAPVDVASSLGAVRGAEAARSEIGQVLAEQGGQAVAGQLGKEAGLLAGQATRSEGIAARGADAENQAIQGLTEAGARKGAKVGKKLAKYEKAMRELRLTDKQIEMLPDFHKAALDDLYRTIKNAPARDRPALVVAQQFSKSLADWRAEMLDGGATPETMKVLDQAIGMSIRDVRDIYGEMIAGPGGELSPMPPRIKTEFRPGGQPLRLREERLGGGRPKASPIRASLSPAQKLKTTAQLPRSVDELAQVMRERITKDTRNKAARLVASQYGRRSDGVLADFGLDKATIDEMAPKDVAAEMERRGYVPWDPESLTGRVKAEDTGPGTLWLPESIQRSIENYYGAGTGLERFMRKYYDKPLTFWKAAVLALRPAWHVNNILSNSLMAMVGGGIDPITYAKRMRQSYALLRLNESAMDVALPEGVARTGPFAAARERRAISPQRLEKLRARVNTIEPGTVQALGGPEAAAPGQLVEGGAGAAMMQPSDTRRSVAVRHPDQSVETLVREPGRLKRFINASYELNGAVDDMNRVAVFLEQRKKLTGADLDNLVAKNPELAGLSPERLRTEGAIRLSLRVAGDFLRMTPVERQVFRRIFPFYVWMRHITGLTAHLIAFHPLRVAWGLHIAGMMGTPGEFGMASAIPLGPGSLLQSPQVVPFGDASQPSPADVGFNVSPVAKLAAGAAFGLDLNRMGQFQRPPGQPGGYGGDPGMTPLVGPGGVRLSELANLIGQQFPQVRAARGVTDALTEGKPVMRYPLGQIRRTAKSAGHKPLGSGEPALGPLARYLGVPYVRSPSPYEKPELRQRLATMKHKRKTAGRT